MRKRHLIWMVLAVCCFASFASAFLANLAGKLLPNLLPLSKVAECVYYAKIVGWFFFAIIAISYLVTYKAFKGIRYFWRYRLTIIRLEKQLIDAGYGIERGSMLELPKVKLSFNNRFESGLLSIQNTIKHDKRLENALLSGALGKMVVETHYLSDDGNWHRYELINGSVSFKMNFNSYDDFVKYSNSIPEYSLFLDMRSAIKLKHMLLVGMTGSGKSYALFSLILQAINKKPKYELFFADPKGSSIAIIGNILDPERTAVNFDDIIKLLEYFNEEMEKRKPIMQKLQKKKLDGDYSSFGLSPYVLIIDEYAAFSAVLAAESKNVRDSVKKLIYNVILQGRQLGFFLFLCMQKSDANLIDTALRENIPFKVVLGNSEPQTYVTTFGPGVDFPQRHYKVGEGVFTEPEVAPSPKLVQFPYFGFEILSACINKNGGGLCNNPPPRLLNSIISSSQNVANYLYERSNL